MATTEHQIIEKYWKNCMHSKRNTLLPYEYDWICFSGGCNVKKRKNEPTKTHL